MDVNAIHLKSVFCQKIRPYDTSNSEMRTTVGSNVHILW